MSYAEAASQAQKAVEKDVSKVEAEAEKQSGNLEKKAGELKAAAADATDKASKKAKEISKDIKKAEQDTADKIKKEYEEKKGPIIDFFKAIGAKISDAAAYVVSSTKSASATAYDELQNPVVATQAVVTLGGIVGLAYGINKRARIFRFKSDQEITAILAGLVGLVVLDGFLFTKNYPKYDKKGLK